MSGSYRAALYIHIPYCVQKCDYCDFYSSCDVSSSEALLRQIPLQLRELSVLYNVSGFSSLYLGGGTPALVNPLALEQMFSEIRVLNGGHLPGEVTMECNPRNVSAENLDIWMRSGINRISLGVQSFQDGFLARAGRKSSREAILRALNLLAERRSRLNLNIDLIQGLPGMDQSDQLQDVTEALDWQPDHLSWYSLIMEPGTRLSREWEERNGDLDTDNENIWLAGCDLIENRGYRRYETSNFCLPGKESRHNSSYWRMEPYLGCGPAAVSMLRSDDDKIVRFKTRAAADEFSRGIVEYDDTEILDSAEFLKDFLMMGLRLSRGIELKRFKKIFGSSVAELIPDSLSLWEGRGCLLLTYDHLRCTEKGMDLLNSILISFFDEIDRRHPALPVNWPG
ncbi:MAG: radical SAM family heme chaperone HemW [Spirochaetales bacterium]|nr:radical SAM family heme chaperone HemW [Spirochaetales bacterium]